MSFSQSGVSGVEVRADGPDLLIRWDSPAPQGTVFQVYVDHRLSWFGTSRRCHAPVPSGAKGRNTWVDVGVVSADSAQRDFSASLSSQGQGGTKVLLSWIGGTYLDPSGRDDVRGFRIYRGTSPGGPVDRSSPVDEVPAYPGGWVSDGFGLGGFGTGGFGRSSTSYVWTSGSLPSGAWQFTIVPCDKAGNDRGAGQTVGLTVAAAPRPPAPSPGGARLSYSYSGPVTRRVALNWLASPSQ